MKTSLREDFRPTVNKVQPPKQFDYLSIFYTKMCEKFRGSSCLGFDRGAIKFTDEKMRVD